MSASPLHGLHKQRVSHANFAHFIEQYPNGHQFDAEAVYFDNCVDMHARGKLTWPKARHVFIACDANFVYYNVNRRTFPHPDATIYLYGKTGAEDWECFDNKFESDQWRVVNPSPRYWPATITAVRMDEFLRLVAEF